jgi:hypothetical protein
MSKILVVQPHRILQHAIGLCLFPQYQTWVTNSIPERTELGEVDAAIIDAAALRETDALSDAALRSLQDWDIPIVWIDTLNAPATLHDTRVIVIRTPITKQDLERALAHCLRDSQEPRRATSPEEPSSSHKAGRGKPDVIDLVEVVEVVEGAPEKRGHSSDEKQL